MSVSVIIPSYHQIDMVLMALSSMSKHDFNALIRRFVVVENSSEDITQKVLDAIGVSYNVTVLNNDTLYRCGWAQAEAYELGLEHVDTEHVFLCHCDINVCSRIFWDVITEKIADGYDLIGAMRDPATIHAVYSCGFAVRTDIARTVDLRPNNVPTDTHECADEVTTYCEREGKRIYVFPEAKLDPRDVQRVMYKGELVFAHLQRGQLKASGVYRKPGRFLYKDWKEFCCEN